jgi:hypothetical protein
MLARNRRACLLEYLVGRFWRWWCKLQTLAVADFGEGSLAQASSSRRLFVCRATAIACSAISFEQLELLSVSLLRRSSRRCDKFLNSSQNYYHIISSVIGSSNPLPMCVSFNLFRINIHEAASSFVTF